MKKNLSPFKRHETVVSDTACTLILEITETRAALCEFYLITDRALRNWVRDRSPMLTTPDSVEIISRNTGLAEAEILTKIPRKIKTLQ